MYIDQHRFFEAEPLLKRVLAIKERRLGKQHPKVATDLDRLAAVYYLQGRYKEAEPLLRLAVAIDEAALGHNDPMTLQIHEHLRLLQDALSSHPP
jgi:hypothetical protein